MGRLGLSRVARAVAWASAGLWLAGLYACGGDEASAGVLARWSRAGLEPSSFQAVDGSAFDGGKCRAGSVKGIAATLCEYGDAHAAKRAEVSVSGKVRETTALAIADGKLLLVLADRERRDPNGKTINEIARTFRDAR